MYNEIPNHPKTTQNNTTLKNILKQFPITKSYYSIAEFFDNFDKEK